LDPSRFLWRNFEPGADELADPDIDLLPQIDMMRIQRVVEIEHPGVDIGEGAESFFHRLTNPQPSSLRKHAFAGTTEITASRSAASCRRSTCRRRQSLLPRGRGRRSRPVR